MQVYVCEYKCVYVIVFLFLPMQCGWLGISISLSMECISLGIEGNVCLTE